MLDQIRTVLLRNTAELEAFVPRWRELWKGDRAATPFQAPEWLLPWWHHFGQAELRAAVALQEGRPAAFLPFYIYPEPSTEERKLLLIGGWHHRLPGWALFSILHHRTGTMRIASGRGTRRMGQPDRSAASTWLVTLPGA